MDFCIKKRDAQLKGLLEKGLDIKSAITDVMPPAIKLDIILSWGDLEQ